MAKKKVIKEGTPEEIFHNDDVLQKSMLKTPYVIRLSRELGLGEEITTNDEFIEALIRRKQDEF